ncbi:carboxymuconolactone decarboxylase family protein [Pedobacter sp. AW31-3R]|uniref:carboxymuconolactone decarboxylase family protein n=1 Tax=Pedobacter sp. AW31-3R TaxID=3445781 RepID=UPI003F9F8194
MESRMKNPALVLGVNPAIQSVMGAIYQSGLSYELLEYVGLRVGQMTSCELCIGEALVKAQSNPVTRDRIEHVLTWRESNVFDELEQTALELTEVVTRLEAKYESVSDELWLKVESYFGEKERAALVLFISIMNMFTRINVSTRQLTAEWA